MTDATPEQLELARKCAAKYWQTGETSDEASARRILSGEWDDHAYTQAALRAIIETTRLSSKMAADTLDKARAGDIDNDLRSIKHILIGRFADDDHIKGRDQ